MNLRNIKEWKQSLFYGLFSTEPDKIFKSIQSADVVSFDLFDTLVKRDVAKPSDVFHLVENHFNRTHNCKYDFYNKRIEAETVARSTCGTEVSLNDIYRFYEDLTLAEELKQLEKQMEIEVCTSYIPMQHVFNECVLSGKVVLIISDMYLDSQFLVELLDKCGYRGYQKLYVSCENLKNKAQGELFEYVRQDSHITGKWIHIGDSIRSDYLNPRRYGIYSKLIKKELAYPRYYGKKEDLLYNQIRCFVQNHEPDNFDEYQRMGYEILGPMLCGFCTWLHMKLQNTEKRHILFLARDSRLFLKAYEIMYGSTDKELIYFYTSRKAALTCVVDLLQSFKEMCDLFAPNDDEKLCNLYRAIGIDEKTQKEINTKASVESDRKLNSLEESQKNIVFKEIKDYKYALAKEQRKLLNRYMEQLGVSQDFAVVDIGWEGRIQWALNRACSANHSQPDIEGFYYCVFSKMPWIIKTTQMHGYIGKYKSRDRVARIIAESVSIFETLMLNNEGSTIGYKEDAFGNVVPNKLAPDQNIDNLSIVMRLQEAALTFIKDIEKRKEVMLCRAWPPEHVFDIYANFAVQPAMRTVNALKNLQFSDKENTILGSERSLIYYAAHFEQFKKDLAKSNCRILFMKSIFKLPMPYYQMLYLYYKMKHT